MRTRDQILKAKSQNARQSMRRRSTEGAFVPSAPDILAWLKEQPMACQYSGEKITPKRSQIDHLIPVDRGGTNDFENLALVSEASNRQKGNLTDTEYLKLLALVDTFDPKARTSVLARLKMAAYVYAK